jgi:hypothetical protein
MIIINENVNTKERCMRKFFIYCSSLILIVILNLENCEKLLDQKMYKMSIK